MDEKKQDLGHFKSLDNLFIYCFRSFIKNRNTHLSSVPFSGSERGLVKKKKQISAWLEYRSKANVVADADTNDAVGDDAVVVVNVGSIPERKTIKIKISFNFGNKRRMVGPTRGTTTPATPPTPTTTTMMMTNQPKHGFMDSVIDTIPFSVQLGPVKMPQNSAIAEGVWLSSWDSLNPSPPTLRHQIPP